MSRNYQKFTEMSRNSQKGLRITRNSQKCQKCPKFWDMPVWERWCCVNSVTVLRQLCHCFQDFTKFLINLLNLLNFYWISDKFTEFAEFRCVWLYLLCPAVSDCPVPAVSGYVRLSRTRMCRTIPVRGCVGGCGGRCRCRWLWWSVSVSVVVGSVLVVVVVAHGSGRWARYHSTTTTCTTHYPGTHTPLYHWSTLLYRSRTACLTVVPVVHQAPFGTMETSEKMLI